MSPHFKNDDHDANLHGFPGKSLGDRIAPGCYAVKVIFILAHQEIRKVSLYLCEK